MPWFPYDLAVVNMASHYESLTRQKPRGHFMPATPASGIESDSTDRALTARADRLGEFL